MNDLKVVFIVEQWEPLSSSLDLNCTEIKGEISLIDDGIADDSEPIGVLEAHLINIIAAVDSSDSLFDLYDSRSAHLLDAYELLFDADEDALHQKLPKKLSLDPIEIEWHLNLTRIDILPEYRGSRCAVRAFRMLQRYIERPGLIVTAKAHPEPRDVPRKPRPSEVKALRDYYLSDRQLGFVPIGKAADGWLVANWSS